MIEAPDLSPYDPNLIKLIWSKDPEPRYISPSGHMPLGFVEGSRRVLEDHSEGTFSKDPPAKMRAIELVGQEQREYVALENGQVVNAFSVPVIVTRLAHFQLVIALGFPQDASDQEKQGWDALIQEYQTIASVAPDNKMPTLAEIVLPGAQRAGLDPARVVVVIRLDVVAFGTPKVRNDPYEQTESIFSGKTKPNDKIARIKANGTTEMVPLGNELVRRHLSYRLISHTPLDQPPSPTPASSPMVQSTENKIPIDQVADKVAREYAKGVSCEIDFSQGATREVMTLLRYPEFKVEWERVTITIRVRWRFIRFSVSITVLWPRVYTRLSDLILIAWTRWPRGVVTAAAQRVVEGCIIKAALIGGVVGVVMSNPAAAWTAFSGAFENCLKEKAFEYVKCLIPGIAVERVGGKWT
ncbi:hypothetical protein ACFP9V_22650 [Deinococcus radiopugnans]|uniref:hypothetical protein n=1 Tax=Deinococcus radiopugnans TaxID=57497 RepID=UPI00161304EC